MEKKSNTKLRIVHKNDYRFLFNLLKERESFMNISHKKMPTFSEHVKFVRSKPYTKWYIIENGKKKVGSIYLSKQDEIGIFIKKNERQKDIGNSALELIMKKNPRERFLANINPKNKKSITFFQKNNFKLIQYTYEINSD
ncbi:MAG: N-acetyltransferase [Chloroflexi bacterium]|nr:N-acetyltransferase [Chloroflexota bacterium]|tara:strand:- start:8072 stop:8491 length:420 start_codon:yes stop_codon:yes gene_type:complete